MTDIFKQRERALEGEFFRKRDLQLLAKLRERARLDEVARALAEKLRVDDAELLRRVVGLGVTRDTGAALLLAPLVQVAWAEGSVTERERTTLLELAASRGVEARSPAGEKLSEWLRERPPDALFDAAIDVIELGLSVLTPAEREETIGRLIEAGDRVAAASGGLLRLLGLTRGVSTEESALLDALRTRLRAGRSARP
jgi:hypothetical protein